MISSYHSNLNIPKMLILRNSSLCFLILHHPFYWSDRSQSDVGFEFGFAFQPISLIYKQGRKQVSLEMVVIFQES